MQKTIAFCLFNYFTYGGLQRDMLRIALGCQRAGASIRVYTMQWDGPHPDGFDIRIVPTHGRTNHGRARRFAAQVQRLLAADPVSLVVGHNRMPGLDMYFGSDVCYAEKIRTKHRLYRLTPRCRTYLALEKTVVGPDSQTHLLLISPRQVEDYKKHYALTDNRYTLLPPGLDESFRLDGDPVATRRRMRTEFGVHDNDFLLLLVGSGFKGKGVDRVIRAMAALPEALRRRCRFVVVGQGKRFSCQWLAIRLGVGKNLHFAGVRHDIPEWMTTADILLHPARVENTGLTLLEALACDLPVLCTAACGYASYIAESNGGIVLDEPFCPDKMRDATARMLDRDQLEQYRRAIRNYRGRTPLSGLVEAAVRCIFERL